MTALATEPDQSDSQNRPQRPGRITPLLVEAVRSWITAPADSEAARLAELRGVAEHAFIDLGIQEALVLPAGNELDVLVQSKVFASSNLWAREGKIPRGRRRGLAGWTAFETRRVAIPSQYVRPPAASTHAGGEHESRTIRSDPPG